MLTICFKAVLAKSTRTCGLHVWAPTFYGPIQPMVHMEKTAWDLFRSYSLSQIQTVQPNIQQSVLNRSNYEVHVIIKISPLVQWGPTWNILMFHQRTDAANVLYGINRAWAFRIFFTFLNPTSTAQDKKSVVNRRNCEVSMCGQRTNTTDESDGKSSARDFYIFFTFPNLTITAQDTVVPPPAHIQLIWPLFVLCLCNCAHARIWCHKYNIYSPYNIY